ncbi:hypothetical protein Dimus_033808 [Dionaea muscipula]
MSCSFIHHRRRVAPPSPATSSLHRIRHLLPRIQLCPTPLTKTKTKSLSSLHRRQNLSSLQPLLDLEDNELGIVSIANYRIRLNFSSKVGVRSKFLDLEKLRAFWTICRSNPDLPADVLAAAADMRED